jgi:hypothetical protein
MGRVTRNDVPLIIMFLAWALVIMTFWIMELLTHVAIRVSLAPGIPLLQNISTRLFPWQGIH